MSRRGGKLSQKQAENARPGNGRRATLLSDGGCLYLQTTLGDGGRVRRSWVFRYERAGARHDMGLGPFPDCGLAEARDRARRLRQQLRDIDPLEVRRELRAKRKVDAARAMTFRECADRYVAAHRAGWRNAKHAAQWTTTIGAYACPIIGDLPVAGVDLPLIMKVIEPIWHAKRETASRLRGRIEAVLDWASVRGYRHGDNPARWRGHLKHLLTAPSKTTKARHAALPWREVPEFMAELRERDGEAARALELVILTAARSGEALGARWSEIDLPAALWVVPAARTKAGRENIVSPSQNAP